jgi:hypothetical protein
VTRVPRAARSGTRRRPGAFRSKLAAVAGIIALLPHGALAEPRSFIETELLTPHFASHGDTRVSLATVGFTYGWASHGFIPYVGGGVGFFPLQARAGVIWLPNDLKDSGLMVRIEARPEIFWNPCIEPALMGNAGIGYRWPLETNYPDGTAGVAFYLLPSFDGGAAWLHRNCNKMGLSDPFEPKFLAGGTIVLGLDM